MKFVQSNYQDLNSRVAQSLTHQIITLDKVLEMQHQIIP